MTHSSICLAEVTGKWEHRFDGSRSIFSIFQKIIKFELILIFECCRLDSLRIVKIDSKPNSDCNYTFSIDLEPNGIPFHAKSIGKGELQSKFGLNQPDLG